MPDATMDLTHDRRRYRKVFARLWADPDFLSLTGLEKLVALYLLTGPQTNRVGLYKLSMATGSEHLSWRKYQFASKAEVCIGRFRWEFDANRSVLWIPSWWSYNQPGERENNFRGALTDLGDVPPTPLLTKFCNNLRDLHPRLHPLISAWNPKPLRPGSVETESPPQSRHRRSSVRTQVELQNKTKQDKTIKAVAGRHDLHSPVENSDGDDLEPEPEPTGRPATDPSFKLLERLAHSVLDELGLDASRTDLMDAFHARLIDAHLDRDPLALHHALDSALTQRHLFGRVS